MATSQTPPGQQGNLPPVSPTPEERKQAIDFAADATKQLITVAAGVITATVIFSKDLNSSARYWALGAWATLTLSVLGGLAVLFIITGKLKKQAMANGTKAEIDRQVSDASLFQWSTFLAGMVLMMIFGFVAAGVKETPPETKPITVNCIVPQTPAPIVLAPPTAQPKSGAMRGS